jgi:hypothetical protein
VRHVLVEAGVGVVVVVALVALAAGSLRRDEEPSVQVLSPIDDAAALDHCGPAHRAR